jgi:[ribosomal protein S18]-alanine N-acetyltransferase
VTEPNRTSILWAHVGDAAELAQLHGEVFDTPWSASAVEQILSHPGSVSLVARSGQPLKAVGFVIGQVAADEAELLSVAVSKTAQRKGTGQALVQAIIRAAKKAGARTLHLEVAADNTAALALYEKLQFTVSGRRKGYYERAGAQAQDAITMALPL